MKDAHRIAAATHRIFRPLGLLAFGLLLAACAPADGRLLAKLGGPEGDGYPFSIIDSAGTTRFGSGHLTSFLGWRPAP